MERLFKNGALAQLGERGLCKPEVKGSIPLSSTKSNSRLRAAFLFLFEIYQIPGYRQKSVSLFASKPQLTSPVLAV